MKRNIVILVIIISIAVIAGLIYFITVNKDNTSVSKNINIVPLKANMLIEINDLSEIIDYTKKMPDFWKSMIKIESVNKFNNKLNKLDSLAIDNELINKMIRENNLILSFHNLGKNRQGILLISQIPEDVKTKNLKKQLKELMNNEVSSHKYENTEINTYRNNKLNFSWSIINKKLVLSRSTLLIEDAIRQSKLKVSILNNEDFKTVYETAGTRELANIYINFKRINHLFSAFLKSDIIENNPFLNNYASWAELDIIPDKKKISLNGFAISRDSSFSYLNHIDNQKENNAEFENILPENTALFFTQSIDNKEKFFDYREKFVDKHKGAKYYTKNTSDFNSKTNTDSEDFISDIVKDQICLAVSYPNSLNLFQNTYLIFSTKSAGIANDKLKYFIKRYTEHTNQNEENYFDTIEMDNNQKFKTFRIPVKSWPANLFGSFFSISKPEYATIIENKIIFANSINSLKKLINDYLLNRTLDKNKNYNQFRKNLSKKHQAYFYMNNSIALPWLKSIFNDKASGFLRENENNLKKFSPFAIQQILSDNMIYNNIVLDYTETIYNKPHTLWESRLDTSVIFKPEIVINHKTGEKEIFVQDKSNNIYLLNDKGHVLWKMPVDEKIISDVYQIDRYKNNKLQYLFNTKSKIYLIDRLGNHVDRYPVKLRTNASCGMSLFDYENNKDYRIIIPAQNKQLYMYNVEGNIVEGWEFEGSDYPLKNQPRHFRHKTKDYIVFHDKFRIYILNRRGNKRIEPQSQFKASEKNSFYFEPGNDAKPSFVTTKPNGTVVKINLNGNIDSLKLSNFSENHYFMYRDINSDGFKDYIFSDNNIIEVYNREGEKLFDYKIKNNISTKPNYYIFSSGDHKLGFLDKKDKNIYLINSKGELHPGFPLTGISPFSITYLKNLSSNFNLLVGGKNNFLYNYEVK